MKAKKNKDLESELINDLLDDDIAPTELENPPAPNSSGGDETIRLNESKIVPTNFRREGTGSESSAASEKSVRVSVGGKFAIKPTTGGRGIGSEAALVQSENLRVAQEKIFELEQEIERLRVENEQLAAAGEAIRKNSDELMADNEIKANQLTDLRERLHSEKEILESSLKAKSREVKDLKIKIEEYEVRLSSNLQKIRVRERELENRLELVKMESTAVVRSKDEIILDLKRQLDLQNNELENFRSKSQDLNKTIAEKQETLRRTVKALRLALSMLEGTEAAPVELKKAK